MPVTSTRHWYQFSLRTLLILTAISSIPPGAYVGYKRYLVAKRLAQIESSFRWFESLGYPQLPDGRPIRITTKHWVEDPNTQDVQTSLWVGFLLTENDNSFTVLTPALRTTTLQRQSHQHGTKAESSFEYVNLRELARSALEQRNASSTDPFYRFGLEFSERGELFVIAWACARRGHGDSAIRLIDAAEACPGSNDKPGTPFLDRLSADFAHMETWRATLDCQTQMPRRELLNKFLWLQQHFSKSEHAVAVAEKVSILEAMVAEDECHAIERKAGLPFDQLSKSEQIDELIFQLRDQNGFQWMQPGWCDVFTVPHGKEDSPAHRLLAYGYDAIPQLVVALTDQRLTRSVGYHRNFYFSHTVLTIGDATEQILYRIANRRFDSAEQHQSKTDRIATIQKNAIAWHAELMLKGERLALIEAVERGDETSLQLADRLLEKHPDDACCAVLVAIPRVNDDYRRRNFVEMLGRVSSDLSVPFLLEELQGERIQNRLAAAQALTNLGRSEGIHAMLGEWQRSNKIAELEGLGPFLAGSRQKDALNALAQRFFEQSIEQRIEAMDRAVGDFPNVLSTPPELRKAVIPLLIVALDDTEVRVGMSGSYGNKSFSDPRVCDLAGYHLNCLDEDAFRFDLGAPFVQREEARLAILKRCLQAAGP